MNRVFIIDNSFYCDSTFPDELTPGIVDFFKQIDGNSDCALIVPDLFPYEAMNALEIASRRKRFSSSEVEEGLFLALKEFVNKVSRRPIINKDSVRRLVKKHMLTAYDASYLELTIEYNAILCATDPALIRAAKAEGVQVWEPGFTF